MNDQRTSYGKEGDGDRNSKGSCRRNYSIPPENLRAINPVGLALGRLLLTGWLAGRLAGWQAGETLVAVENFKIH